MSPTVQSLAQRTVRHCAVLVLATLCASGPVLYVAAPHARTKASIGVPDASPQAVLEGAWSKSLEVHLRESSPVTAFVRGLFSEWLFELALLDSEKVHFGRDGWLFLRYGLEPDLEWWTRDGDAIRGQRLRFLRDLRARAHELGVDLLVAVVPDKDRIYPEKCWPSGRLPGSKQGLYARIQAELAECGLQGFDGEAVLLEYKRAHPGAELFFARDTHWTMLGGRVFAEAIREKLAALGWLERLGPSAGIRAQRIAGVRKEPDLVDMLGFREGSPLRERLAHARDGRIPAAYPRRDALADAPVALAGTSYSANALDDELPIVLDRLVDERGTCVGGGPFPGLLKTLAAIRSGDLHARLVIWEFPERSVLEGGLDGEGNHWGWLYPPRLPQGR